MSVAAGIRPGILRLLTACDAADTPPSDVEEEKEPELRICEIGAWPDNQADPATRQSTTRDDEALGANGTFTDECDEGGNLREYLCETTQVRGEGLNAECDVIQTGRVQVAPIDCVGTCEGGRCGARCPQAGDQLTYLSVEPEGGATFENEADGRRYSCALHFGEASTCSSESRVGARVPVRAFSGFEGQCTGTDFGSIGLEGCTFSESRRTPQASSLPCPHPAKRFRPLECPSQNTNECLCLCTTKQESTKRNEPGPVRRTGCKDAGRTVLKRAPFPRNGL